MTLPRVLITGANGTIGTILTHALADSWDVVALDLSWDGDEPAARRVTGSITDGGVRGDALDGVDRIVHLATGADQGWDGLLDTDIVGTRDLLVDALEEGVQRVVFASTNHVIGGYELERFAGLPVTVGTEEGLRGPVRPDSEYGAAKAFVEAYLRYLAETTPLSASCLRIGTVKPVDDPGHYADAPDFAYIPGGAEGAARRLAATWLRHDDLVELVEEELRATDRYRVRYGVSDSPGRFWPLEVYAWNPSASQVR